jgi:hypothetical protein
VALVQLTQEVEAAAAALLPQFKLAAMVHLESSSFVTLLTALHLLLQQATLR